MNTTEDPITGLRRCLRDTINYTATLERRIERLRIDRNSWRIIAGVLALGYLVIVLNTYVFGGGA